MQSVATTKHLALWSPRPNALVVEQLSSQITLYGLPSIRITPLPLTTQQQNNLQQAEVCLFISQHAVSQLLSQIAQSELVNKTIVAIGEKTAQTLISNGLSVDITAVAPHTSEALLAMPTFQQLVYHRLAIICGQSGRKKLQKTLTALEKKVYRIPCYQRNMCDLSRQTMLKFMSKYSIAGVIVTSCRIADAVLAALCTEDKDFFHCPMFALSQRIGDYLSTLGFTQIIVAEAANQQSLNQTIITWWDSR